MNPHVMVASHSYVAAINRGKLQALTEHVTLSAVVPKRWPDQLFDLAAAESDARYRLYALPAAFTGRVMRYFYSPLQLARTLDRVAPQLICVEAEPASLALAQFAWLKARYGYRLVAFTWENTDRRAGLPGLARFSLARCDGLVAGNHAAAQRIRQLGYQGAVTITPQLGLDPTLFAPSKSKHLRTQLGLTDFTVGFVGRLTREKGLHILFRALESASDIQLLIVGRGPIEVDLDLLAENPRWATRVKHIPAVPHAAVPEYLRACDVVVLPSLTTSDWKEQFGHILIEAMACGVPVIGSNSGAIPEVVGEAGVIVPEGDADALRTAIMRLSTDTTESARLAESGRARVLAHYTHAKIAAANAAFFRQILAL